MGRTAMLLAILTCLSICARASAIEKPCKNDRPLIGVLTQPGRPAPKGHSYIAASYIKFIEAGGARAVPILYDTPPEDVVQIFKSINGVIIPGGSQNLSPSHPFYDTAAQLMKLAMESYDQGSYFPVWGTCLGFEALSVIISGNSSILGGFDAENLPSTLIFSPEAEHSIFYQELSPAATYSLQHLPVAMENHMQGLGVDAVKANPALDGFVRIVSYSEDRNKKLYVSVFEAKKYPIFGVQWHPEKNAFEWMTSLNIPHSTEAIEVTQAVARFVVDQARKNCNKPAGVKDLEQLLIYNYKPTFTGQHHYEGEEVDFDECYFFPELYPQNTKEEASAPVV